MAEKYPSANGLWSDDANWNGGVKPTTGDTAHANGYTITLDEDVTCDMITTTAGATASAGGEFDNPTTGNPITLTCNILAGSTPCVDYNNHTHRLVVVGDITGSSTTNSKMGIDFNGSAGGHITGTLTSGNKTSTQAVSYFQGTVIGDIYQGGGNAAYGLHTAYGHVDVTGDMYGGSDATSAAVNITGVGTATIVGDAYGGTASNAWGLMNSSNGIVTMDGTAYSSATSSAVWSNPAKASGVIVTAMDYNGSDFFPASGKVFFANDASLVSLTVEQEDGSELIMDDASQSGTPDYPAEADVSEGVSYAYGAKTGTAELTTGQIIDGVAKVVGDTLASNIP